MSPKGILAVALFTSLAYCSPAAAAGLTKATQWYVLGLNENYAAYTYSSFYFVMNPGKAPGLVTLSIRNPDGTELCNTSDTAAPMSQIVLYGFACNAAHVNLTGYAVITSEVPVIVSANQFDGNGNRHLDAFPGKH